MEGFAQRFFLERARDGFHCKLRPCLAWYRIVQGFCGLVLFAIFFGPLTGTQPLLSAKEEKLPVINIEKKAWKVFFQGFVIGPGSQAPRSEVAKITGVLAKSLHGLQSHVLDENEKRNLRKKAIQEELYKYYKQYNDLVEKRDRASFKAAQDSYSQLAQRTDQIKLDQQIRDKADLIARLQNFNYNLISVPDSLPLEFTDGNSEPYVSPNIVLLRDDYDIFIGGVARGRNDIFQVEVRAYISSSKRNVTLWQGIVGKGKLGSSLEQIRTRVSSLLLGRPWAAMKVDVSTSTAADAQIYLDGRLQGENSLLVYGLYPERSYELEIIAAGLQGKHFFVELEAGKLNHFQFSLDIAVPEKYIQVDASSPAEVYQGVRYVGETPLQLRMLGYATLLVLVAPDKRTINYDLDPGQDKDLYFEMERAPVLTLQEERQKRQRRFYWSSALFMISLAIPVISLGIGLVNQGLYVNNVGNSTANNFRESMYTGFGVAIGGGVLSAILLGLNIYDFTQYTKATKALSTTDFSPEKVPEKSEEAQDPPKPRESQESQESQESPVALQEASEKSEISTEDEEQMERRAVE